MDHLNKRFGFITQNLSLTIQAAQQQDSGFYIFEATDEHGKVKDYTFQVSVFGESLEQRSLPLGLL